MRNFIKSKYFKWGATIAAALVVVVFVYFLLAKVTAIHIALSSFTKILAPFIYGIIMAYLLRPIYNRSNYLLEKSLKKAGVASDRIINNVSKTVSVFFSITLLIFIVTSLIMMVLPQLVVSVYETVIKLPDQAIKLMEWINNIDFHNETVKSFVIRYINLINDNLDGWLQQTLVPYVREFALSVSSGIRGAASFVFDILVGLIVCVYILLSKNTFAAQAKKICFSVFAKDTSNMIIRGARYADKVFKGFVVGNIIDSLIVGVITFIVMTIFQWPFALLISAVLAVTNLIPFFGPFIGGIPSAILVLTEDPMTAVYFVIFMVILQQIEGNIIKPKILSESIDLSSFWILFAIVVGGGIFGLPGMILGVPIFTLIYAFIDWLINRQLAKKNLPEGTNEYSHVDVYDFEAGEFKYLPEDMIQEQREERRTDRLLRKKRKQEKKERQINPIRENNATIQTSKKNDEYQVKQGDENNIPTSDEPNDRK